MSSLNLLPGKLEIVSLQNRWLSGTESERVSQCLQNRCHFFESILGEQMRKRGECATRACLAFASVRLRYAKTWYACSAG